MDLYTAIPTSKEEIPRIQAKELKEMIDRGERVVIVDCNPRELFEEEHIPGAINLPWNFQGLQEDPELPKNIIIAAYCLCAHEEDSGDIAFEMIATFGYRNVQLLQGGNAAWKNLGYPVQKAA